MRKWILRLMGLKMVPPPVAAPPLIVKREGIVWNKADAEQTRIFLESETGKRLILIVQDAIAEDAQMLRSRDYLAGRIETLAYITRHAGETKKEDLEQNNKETTAMWVKEEDE